MKSLFNQNHNNPASLIKKYQKSIANIKKIINKALSRSGSEYEKIQNELIQAQEHTIKLFEQIRNDRTLFSNDAARREDARKMFANSWCSEKEIEMAIIAPIEHDSQFRTHLPVSTEKSKILELPEAFVYELIDPFSPNFAQDRKWL